SFRVREQPAAAPRSEVGPQPGGLGWPQADGGVRPHRAWAVFGLGVLSLAFLCCPPASWVCGGMAVVMAHLELRQMAQGMMDSKGRGTVEAGRVLAILGLFLSSLVFMAFLFVDMSR